MYEGWSPICFSDIYDPELSEEENEDQFYRYAEEQAGQVIEEWIARRRGTHKLIDSGHEAINLYGVTWALFKVKDRRGQIGYVECKTYSKKQSRSSFRTFYFSPSDDPKIAHDAFHFLMTFELEEGLRNAKRAFIPVSWSIYALENLVLQLKREFNAGNKALYDERALLARGEVS